MIFALIIGVIAGFGFGYCLGITIHVPKHNMTDKYSINWYRQALKKYKEGGIKDPPPPSPTDFPT